MKRCLVSLVSDQTIPNILVAAHFQPDCLLFISTEKMESKGKTQAILDTLTLRDLDYSGRYQKLEVVENSIIDLQNKVSQWLSQTQEEYQFIVNLSGGNKLMSLAAYDFFKELGSDMVYVPIPDNRFLVPFPKLRPKPSGVLQDRLTVIEYLTAWNFKIVNMNTLKRDRERAFAQRDLTDFIFDHYEQVKPLLKWLRIKLPERFKKEFEFQEKFAPENEAQARLLQKLGFPGQREEITKRIHKSEWHYLRGGWLEERLFLAIVSALSPEVDVHLGVEFVDHHNNKNELDVLFTYENTLYLVECKSLDPSESKEDKIGINDFFYKLGALRQQFGLTPRAFFASTSGNLYDEKGNVKFNLTDRAKQFSIEIIPLSQTPDLEGYFRKHFTKRD